MATDAQSQPPVIDEEQYYHDAQLGALWSASRMLVPVVAALYGGIYFAYFYLRSLDSSGLWDPHGVIASPIIGFSVMALVVGAAVIQFFVNQRLRRGFTTDFIVGSVTATVLLVVAAAGQIWQLTRLPFLPGASGYAGVFVAYAPVNALIIGLSAYWIFTIVMRAVRSSAFYKADGGVGVSGHRAAENFRANLDGYSFFIGFMIVISVVSWYLYYVLA
ncbi:MAG: hypothetical protein ACYDHP_01675 [Ferrimicrobium sp.]